MRGQRKLSAGSRGADTDIIRALNSRSGNRINGLRVCGGVGIGTARCVLVVHRHGFGTGGRPFHADGCRVVAIEDGSAVHRPNIIGHTRFRVQNQHIRCVRGADTDCVVARNGRGSGIVNRDGGRGGSRTLVAVGDGNGHGLAASLGPVSSKAGGTLTSGNHTVIIGQRPDVCRHIRVGVQG